jgi:hypothetical protein
MAVQPATLQEYMHTDKLTIDKEYVNAQRSLWLKQTSKVQNRDRSKLIQISN